MSSRSIIYKHIVHPRSYLRFNPHVNDHTYRTLLVQTYIYTYMCTYLYAYIHTYTYTDPYIYIYIYVCIPLSYIHTHIHKLRLFIATLPTLPSARALPPQRRLRGGRSGRAEALSGASRRRLGGTGIIAYPESPIWLN